MAKIRVLLTDDHTLFRQGIKTLISAETDMEVAGEAADGADAVTKALVEQPDVILIDAGIPVLNSLEVTRQIKKNRPETKILFLNEYDDDDYLVECMEAGASGYVLNQNLPDQLVTAIRDVHGGGSYLSPRMLLRIVNNYRSRVDAMERQPRVSTLTSREQEVLKLLAEGKCVKEIACEFNLSMKTVESHKFNLMRKLDIHNKAQLVKYAIEKKIVKDR